MPSLHEMIVRPILTEKSSARLAVGEYTFEVHAKATKPEIKKAIQILFDVEVAAVRTMVQPARRKSMGKSVGRIPRWKKAIVKLAAGQTIEMFGGAG
ncbi:MAG: 50S ribosomal protein L23 [Gemmatimonadales bacterium]